jgi:hypothetical protein
MRLYPAGSYWSACASSPSDSSKTIPLTTLALAARRDEIRILNSQQALLESDQFVGMSLQKSSKRRQLDSLLAKRAI